MEPDRTGWCFFFLFFSSKYSSLMRTKQYRLQKRYSFNFILRRELSPPTFFAWMFRKKSNFSNVQSAWNSCYFLLATVYMLEQVTTAGKNKVFIMFRLDIMNDVNVNIKAVFWAFHIIFVDMISCRHIFWYTHQCKCYHSFQKFS